MLSEKIKWPSGCSCAVMIICASYGNIKGVKKNGVSKGMSKSRLFI